MLIMKILPGGNKDFARVVQFKHNHPVASQDKTFIFRHNRGYKNTELHLRCAFNINPYYSEGILWLLPGSSFDYDVQIRSSRNEPFEVAMSNMKALLVAFNRKHGMCNNSNIEAEDVLWEE